MNEEKKNYQQTTSDYIVQTINEKLHLVKHYDFINKLSAYTAIEGEITLGKLQTAKVRIDRLFNCIKKIGIIPPMTQLYAEELLKAAYFGDENSAFMGFNGDVLK